MFAEIMLGLRLVVMVWYQYMYYVLYSYIFEQLKAMVTLKIETHKTKCNIVCMGLQLK